MTNLEISCHVSKELKYQIHWKSVWLEQICSMGRETDRYYEAHSRFRNFWNALSDSYDLSVVAILCSWNTSVCAADSSWFCTVTGLWYWVAVLCECCDTEWLICVNVVIMSGWFVWVLWYWVADLCECCDTEWLICVSVVILSGWFVWMLWLGGFCTEKILRI